MLSLSTAIIVVVLVLSQYVKKNNNLYITCEKKVNCDYIKKSLNFKSDNKKNNKEAFKLVS